MPKTKTCPRCGTDFIVDRQNWAKRYCSISCGAKKTHYDTRAVLLDIKCKTTAEILSKHCITTRSLYALMHKTRAGFRNRFYGVKLTATQKSLIMGALLGDACATKTASQKWRISFVHGPKQYKYLDWKYQAIKNIVQSPPKKRITQKAYGTESMTFKTRLNKEIGNIADQLYQKGTKTVTLEYLNQLDTLALAVWILDDGNLNKNGGSLSTHAFTPSESRLIASWFGNRYKLPEPKLVLDKRCHKFSIRFTTKMAKAIARECYAIIAFIPDMAYKVNWHAEVNK